jgi:hypothetical protein
MARRAVIIVEAAWARFGITSMPTGRTSFSEVTRVLGLEPALAGFAIMIALIADAISAL